MNTNQKIASLRLAMKQNKVSAYIIPSQDPHMSEYVTEHFKARQYFSGFTGSAGTLVVTEKGSGLWTDGRYFIQAEHQLSGSEVQLFKMGQKDVPTYIEYIVRELEDEQTVAIDGKLFSAATVKNMKKSFKDKKLKLNTSLDLVEGLWEHRPAVPLTEVYYHETTYTGLSCQEKLEKVREVLKSKKADGYVITELASIAWLFNIRASDIDYNPMAIAYAYVSQTEAYLCINGSRVPKTVVQKLNDQGVVLKAYEEIEGLLKGIKEKTRVLCHTQNVNQYLYDLLDENPVITIVEDEEIVIQLKAVKNNVEIENMIQAHIKDGCALTHFMVDFEKRMAKGEKLTEYDLLDLLIKARLAQPNNKGESFNAIVAYKENAAMMHYAPTEESHKILEKEGLLLIDSGGQYLEGTTDITRTFALGPVTDEEKRAYTLTLKSHIAMARAIFLEGCSGANLDVLAREPMWENGLDYKCGTGHGIGFMLGVHEGPHSLRTTNHVPLKPGMALSNEPGVYAKDQFGIRIENILVVKEHMTTESGTFYRFDNITFFPIDTKPIQIDMLEPKEINWLNDYHQTIYKTLSPRLEGEALEWLKANTQPIGNSGKAYE